MFLFQSCASEVFFFCLFCLKAEYSFSVENLCRMFEKHGIALCTALPFGFCTVAVVSWLCPSQPFVHPQPTHWHDNVRSRNSLDTHAQRWPKHPYVINTVLVTNSRCSIIGSTRKKINSIPAKSCRVGCQTALGERDHNTVVRSLVNYTLKSLL